MHPVETLSFTSRVAKRAQYEAFEFSIVPDGIQVRNCSHEHPEDHEYVVTIQEGRPTACECPADARFEGACKHRVAIAIRRPVIEAATTQVATDGGVEQTADAEQDDQTESPSEEEDCDCANLPDEFPCWECVRTGKRDLP